jgi:hypothetical protein
MAFLTAMATSASSLPDERTRAGRLAEGDAELHVRGDGDDGLVEVLDRLDEMGLAEDEVHVLRLVDGDGLDVHGALLSCAGLIILFLQKVWLTDVRACITIRVSIEGRARWNVRIVTPRIPKIRGSAAGARRRWLGLWVVKLARRSRPGPWRRLCP